MQLKKFVFLLIHIIFISGLFYDFALFLGTGRDDQEVRRLYAYEGWIIGSFYILFIVLTLISRDYSEKLLKQPREYIHEFRKILKLHLLLLIFPWGVFVLTAPQRLLDILGIGEMWVKIMSLLSIISAFFYYLPYHYYKEKISYYVLLVGAFANFIIGVGFSILFYLRIIPITIWSTVPILLYYAYFFWEQSRQYSKVLINLKKLKPLKIKERLKKFRETRRNRRAHKED
jgi:hypothetical protein